MNYKIAKFGNYLLHDLKNAWRTIGMSGIIVAASPLILFLSAALISLIFTGSVPRCDSTLSVVPAIIVMVFLVINAPVKMYGSLTERRVGSDWTLLPAPAWEKTLSMILTAGIIVPAICIACYLAFDFFTSLLIPDYEVKLSEYFTMNDKSMGAVFLITMVTNILWFLLGAIWFKKSKKAKTILALFLISGVFSSLFFLFLSHLDMDSFNGLTGMLSKMVEEKNLSADQALSLVKWSCFALNIIEMAVISALIYWRVRTIQH